MSHVDKSGETSTSSTQVTERNRLLQEYIYWSRVAARCWEAVQAGRQQPGWHEECDAERSWHVSSHLAALFKQKLQEKCIPIPDWDSIHKQ